jgi:hypothetical protein
MHMQKIILTILLFQFAFICIGQTMPQKKYMAKWTYPKTSTPIHGVLIHFSPVAGCGYIRTATLSIVKTDKGDTIRVLQMCDTTKKVMINSKVTLLPTTNRVMKAIFIPSDPATDCKINQTYYGQLLRD